MDIIIRHNKIENIPLLEMFSNDGIKAKPLVIMFHGYGCQKEFVLIQAYNLALNGFYIVMPDAFAHGERATEGNMHDIFGCIQHTAGEINMLIEHYKSSEMVDASRVGLTGFSMGGMITYYYLATQKHSIKAAAPVIASPDWVSIVKTDDYTTHLQNMGASDIDMERNKRIKIAEEIQPLNNIGNMKDVPLLIQNGGADTLMPVAEIKDFIEKLESLYADKNDLKFIMYPDVGHTDNVPMNYEIASWFKKYLMI